MSSHHITHTAGLALSIAALAAPSALASGTSQSFVSPDAQDAAAGATAGQSFVSPDAQDAAAGATAGQTFASPDARDAAEGRGTWSAPEVTVVKVPAATPDSGQGMSWPAAGIGAGGVVGVILLAGGTVALVSHRPRRRRAAAH